MAYTPTQWVNGQPPALNAENLNKIEAGIAEAHNQLIDVEELDETVSALLTVFGVVEYGAVSRLFTRKSADNQALLMQLIGEETRTQENVLDRSQYVDYKIKNDSGVEIVDGSSYFTQMIPVTPGETVNFNYGVQRIYLYDENKNWLRRTVTDRPITAAYGDWTVPVDTHYIQTQYNKANSYNIANAEDNVWVTHIEYTDTTVSVTGKNLLNKDNYKYRTIKNNNGVETSDYSSSYFTQMIPVTPGEIISFNYGVQRIYLYDENKNWLRRTDARGTTDTPYEAYQVPEDTYYIQTQYSNALSINIDIAQVERSLTVTDYEEYSANTYNLSEKKTQTWVTGPSISNVFIESGGSVNISALKNDKAIDIPACLTYQLWELDEATDEYASAIGPNMVTISISLEEFLTEYYDAYLGTNSNGYKVTKKSIGRDSSNEYEVMEYTFAPKHYSKTVMLSSGMNPCETSPMFGIAYLIKKIMDGTDEPGLNYLRENVRFIVVPCICPWGFDQNPLKYYNYNDVRINKNFDYNGSWSQMTAADYAGTSADSEAETKILKDWINRYAYNADLWIDCHSDTFGNSPYLHQVITSNLEVGTVIRPIQQLITDMYVSKGYITDPTAANVQPSAYVSPITNYPKTLYAYNISGIPSMMIEQYVNGTFYGSDGSHNNDSYGIKNYTTMLRAYILGMLKSDGDSYTLDDAIWESYQRK